jgi:beta-glucuronidase
VQGGPREWHALFDVVCINRYYGWYTYAGQLERGRQALAEELDELHAALGKPIIVAEFGVDTLPGAHATPLEMWTEEYQVNLLRGFLDVAAERPFVAGMNHKGVFTRDRRSKMAAHFLRQRWEGQ